MISDPNKGLTISYNYLNLPETITMPSGDGHIGVIQFVYDAMGQKHRKIVSKKVSGVNSVTTTDLKMTDYVGGYEYEVTNPISDNGVVLNPANSLPSRIHHTEGAITKEANSNVFQYEYVLRDHLGNTRVTFKDKNNDADIEYWNADPSINEVSQINHFYPYGLNMEGNWNGASGVNKYQYNAKEWNDDFGLGLSDYGARWYQSDAPHWLSIDPSAEKHLNNSPYNYTLNNPVKYVDPDGMDNILYIVFLGWHQDQTINNKEIVAITNYILQYNNINAKAVGLTYSGTESLDISKLDATDKIAYVGSRKAINNMNIAMEKNDGYFEIGLGFHKGDSDSGKGEGRISVTNTSAFFPYIGENNYDDRSDDAQFIKENGEGFGISTNIAKNIVHEMGHNILGISHPDGCNGGCGRYNGIEGATKPNLMLSGNTAVRQPFAQLPALLKALPIDLPILQNAFPNTHTPTDNWSKPKGVKKIE